MCRPSGTSATPRRATCSGRSPRRERPRSRTSPPASRSAPTIACSVDDLPAPFGPTSPTISPWPIAMSMPRTAGTPPYATWTASSSSAGTSDIATAPAEIRVRDVDVLPHLGGRSLRECPPLVEHVDAVANLHDQRHVVVDQQHARAVVVADRAHDRDEVRHLGL